MSNPLQVNHGDNIELPELFPEVTSTIQVSSSPTESQQNSSKRSFSFKMPSLNRGAWAAIIILIIISVVLIVSLVSTTFIYVEWNQWAFKKNTASNQVDKDTVYGPGRYAWGPSYTAVTLPSTAQSIDYLGKDALSVFTSAGLEIIVECSFQYQLPRSAVRIVYDSFGLSFHPQIANVGKALLKNAAPTFSESDYYHNRDHISQVLRDALTAGVKNRTGIDVKIFQVLGMTHYCGYCESFPKVFTVVNGVVSMLTGVIATVAVVTRFSGSRHPLPGVDCVRAIWPKTEGSDFW
eukprot:TRINITY_DN2002_c0_g1_i2.p1 TRINITY_DN2002_c0_g1~~TRINITY_DN2002_c0_g1_i2.p1  ORF type:complete len:293 (+),score=10.77 TRINITY_DN2002_c0_g1_i2:84-962(+)